MTVTLLLVAELLKRLTIPDCVAALAKNNAFIGLVRVGGNVEDTKSSKKGYFLNTGRSCTPLNDLRNSVILIS
jgi:hypothetical protein